MEAFASPATWGSPVGIAMLLVSVGAFFVGLGIMLWGAGNDKKARAIQAEVALKERQFNHERKRDEQA